MVTWGPNTTHTIGGAAAGGTTPAFGSPAPAGGSLFGSTAAPAPAFGTPPPAPGGSLFGAPSGSLFGTPAPAPASGSVFGSPAPASTGQFGAFSSTSLFGAPAPTQPSLFGSTTTSNSASLFGGTTTTTQQQQQQQIPAQAALQAHMDASARQEAERVRTALERLHAAYSGTSLPTSGEESKFVAIVYNQLTPEQRQLQWLNGMGSQGTILAPDRPPQVSEKQWKKAVVDNPDPQNFMPQALVGALALQGRIHWQQERAKELGTNAATLAKSQETIKQRSAQAQQDVEEKARRHATLKKRLLDVMRRVELGRCMNQPIQPDELKALQRLSALHQEVESMRGVLISLQDKARTQTAALAANQQATITPGAGIPSDSQLLPVLKGQREKLEKLTSLALRDQRDISLIQKRTAATASVMPRV